MKEPMERIRFDSLSELAEYMVETVDFGDCVTAVLFEEDAMKLIKEFALYDDVDLWDLEISKEEVNGYYKEYYISLFVLENRMTLWASPAWNGDQCLFDDSDLILIDGKASYSIVKAMNARGFKGEFCEIEIECEDTDECFEEAEADNPTIVDTNTFCGCYCDCTGVKKPASKMKRFLASIFGK